MHLARKLLYAPVAGGMRTAETPSITALFRKVLVSPL